MPIYGTNRVGRPSKADELKHRTTALSLWDRGHSVEEIAKVLGLGSNVVRRTIKKYRS